MQTQGKCWFSLSDLAQSHDRVVIDSSVILSTDVSRDQQEWYHENLRRAFKEHENIITVSDVVGEIEPSLSNYNGELANLIRSRTGKEESSFSRYNRFIGYIVRSSEGDAILGPNKKFPFTDIKLAAFAFSLSNKDNSVAFASSDRTLNDVVSRFPFPTEVESDLVRASSPINVYSFVQSLSFFTSHELESRKYGRKHTRNIIHK